MSERIDGGFACMIDRFLRYHGIAPKYVWIQENDPYRYGVDHVLDGTCSIYETHGLCIII